MGGTVGGCIEKALKVRQIGISRRLSPREVLPVPEFGFRQFLSQRRDARIVCVLAGLPGRKLLQVGRLVLGVCPDQRLVRLIHSLIRAELGSPTFVCRFEFSSFFARKPVPRKQRTIEGVGKSIG